MKKVFRNESQVQCLFTDDGISFLGKDREIYFPYGSIETIKMSFMGILQVARLSKIGTFAVDRKDRAEMKKMIAFAQDKMKTAPSDEPRIIDLSLKDNPLVPSDLPDEEKLKRYKALFVQGEISKEEYDARKLQLKKK